jgi:dual specificity phosphatase 12
VTLRMELACRRELAAREHMMDHGQLSPPTPAALSRASSFGEPRGRRNSVIAGLRMSRVDDNVTAPSSGERSNSRKSSFSGGLGGTFKMTPLANDDGVAPSSLPAMSRSYSDSSCPPLEAPPDQEATLGDESALYDSDEDNEAFAPEESPAADDSDSMSTSPLPDPPILLSPSEISAQLPTSLAALRRSSLVAALKTSPTSPTRSSSNYMAQSAPPLPILVNPTCSGYFVEPVRYFPLLQPLYRVTHSAVDGVDGPLPARG